jgi:outer membrane protein OmpA-like peptidoglycan-associated protein
MKQKELNEENEEIKNKAYELYEQHGFKDGNDYVDWLEAERQTGKQSGSKRKKQKQSILLPIVIILCVIAIILLFMLLKKSPEIKLPEKSLSETKVMVLVLDSKADEKVLVFGDTHFDFDKFTLTPEAKTLLDKDVQLLDENPETDVRMAGYTSGQGTEDSNQKLSEDRANAVRDYLIEKGIAPERITTIGYGRTKPALYEVTPGDINTKEAKANMRVLFEIVVK